MIEAILNGHAECDAELEKKVVDFSFDLSYKVQTAVDYGDEKEMSDEGFRAYLNSIKVNKAHREIYMKCWTSEVIALKVVRDAMIKNPSLIETTI